MRTNRWSFILVAALSFSFVSAIARADDNSAPTTAPAAPDPAKVIEPPAGLVGGEWHIKANWQGGAPLDARTVYTWGVGKKFINAKTYVNAPEGEYQRYETVFGGEDGRLKAWQFAFDGHFIALDFTVDGKKFSNSRPLPGSADAPGGILHQSLEIIEPNKLHWVVKFERDGKVQPLIEGDWIRDPAAAPSSSR